ncbi:exodeoxyribonuclease V subunit beta [uncultured Psychroserpens sp.]|uniref:UvrD-helicase domain-containing protein n=1 Tax=uncultured Psychroserpens sp. TaxID=255436 RepID=UPI00260CBB91|nr:UvrD-helicase domain-containing protein [uncultured Psychroserpens sp.]
MQNQSLFTIYNAAAGSGKTYTLVKDYLKILFKSQNLFLFKTVLALTFTNKAVAEMKERIIDTLKAFANPDILTTHNGLFGEISNELNITTHQLHEKSKALLQTIVHNYAAFDISTIDKFNHKLIRTFAYDLDLPLNFEVELDQNIILGQAVDKLIDKAGSDAKLTKVLVDFAMEKIDDKRSWDIAYDLNKISELLINENEIPFINKLKDKTLEDYRTLKVNLNKQHQLTVQQIKEVATKVLELIDEYHIAYDDFSSGYIPKHFIKLSEGNFKVSFTAKWQEDLIEGNPITPKRVSDDVTLAIETIRHQLTDVFKQTKDAIFKIKFLENVTKNLTPLSVLSEISKTLDTIKTEENMLLISEFNSIINSEIKEQPAPFIYERIGEKFKHYFIDEFQDTSLLQWENLIPLISNAISGENLEGETGTAMIVGDAKQAIYRWRGGYAEQFISLYSEDNPFHVKKAVKNLPANYRSYKTIVEFNNAFFDQISDFTFTNPQHKKLYKSAKQDLKFDSNGYIEISFLETKDQDKDQMHCEAVIDAIEKAEKQGFKRNDICIIVRKKKEGLAIAEYLSSLQIDIISSETLLLKNAPEINFLIDVLSLITQPKNNEIKIKVLHYLAEYKLELDDKHTFYSKFVSEDLFPFFQNLTAYGIKFNIAHVIQLPIYEAVETIIRQFKLHTKPNAYIQFFLDEILDYALKYNTGIWGFLNYWERKKNKLSIVSPQNENAIQIMTIHKSKGLEFPVVIFPYANQNIYADINPKIWFPVDSKKFEGFSNLYINMNKDLEGFNETGKILYNDYRSQLELDSINLLYVALTRPVEQLYIISEYDVDRNGNEKTDHYSGLFINYLKSIGQWINTKLMYHFGNSIRTSEPKKPIRKTIIPTEFISTVKETHNLNIVTRSGYLWDTLQEKAIEKGNLIHLIMSSIKTKNDVEYAFDELEASGEITKSQTSTLKPIINDIITHDALEHYFKPSLTIYNEREILTANGQIIRPDRIVIDHDSVTIIDYKTGIADSKHQEQLYDYQSVLETMNFQVVKKILVYINDEITIKEF